MTIPYSFVKAYCQGQPSSVEPTAGALPRLDPARRPNVTASRRDRNRPLPSAASESFEVSEFDRRTAARPATPGAIYLDCRLCWRRLKLEAERVEVVHWEYVYRCPHCDSTFLIREDDAAALGVRPTEPLP